MKLIIFKSLIVLFYFSMIYVNYLANSLPINNQDTGQISGKYPSLFTPSGFAFSIWGIIYIMLGIYVFKTVASNSDQFNEQYKYIVMGLFMLTSVFNITWLLCWHYDLIVLSTIIMILFLIANVITVRLIPSSEVLMKSTFSLYAGWIMIALIANITIMLVKLDLPIFSQNQVLWYVIVITVGLAIISSLLIFDRNVIYGLVFIWAFFAILMKHIGKEGHYLTTQLPIYYTGAIIVAIIALSLWSFINNGYKLFS